MRTYKNDLLPDVLYLAISADKYELTRCVRDSVTSLAYAIGMEPWRMQEAFLKSQSGVIKPPVPGIKCIRIDSHTGETIVGGLRKHFKS